MDRILPLQQPVGHTMYGVAFNNVDPRYSNVFACVGGEKARVFVVDAEPESDPPKGSDGERRPERSGTVDQRAKPLFRLVQEYVDGRGLVHVPDGQGGERGERGEEYYCCAWSCAANGDPLLCFGGKLAIIKVVNYERREVCSALQGHGMEINEIKPHPTKFGIILSTSKDQSVRVWNVQTSTVVMILAGLDGHKAAVYTADFHQREGTLIASGSEDHTTKIWDLSGHQDLVDLSFKWYGDKGPPGSFPTAYIQTPTFSTVPHDNYVDCVCWHGDLLLTKCTQGHIILWRPEHGAGGAKDGALPLKTFKMDHLGIFFMKFSTCASDPHQPLVALGNCVGKVLVWEVEGGGMAPKEVMRLTVGTKGGGKPRGIIRQTSFSWDGRHLACVTEEGKVCLWRIKS